MVADLQEFLEIIIIGCEMRIKSFEKSEVNKDGRSKQFYYSSSRK